MLAGLAAGAVAIFAPEQGSSLMCSLEDGVAWGSDARSFTICSAIIGIGEGFRMGGVGLSRAGHTLNFGFRPFASLQDRPYERAESARKRS